MCRALFTGTATALATPFSSGSVDTDALSRLIDFQLEHRVDALVVCGTTGEAPVLTQSEKDSILSLALERTNGRIPVIMGAGGNNTCAVIAAARRAQALGASGILSVTPYYNRPGQRGLIAHYSAVADALDIPVSGTFDDVYVGDARVLLVTGWAKNIDALHEKIFGDTQ